MGRDDCLRECACDDFVITHPARHTLLCNLPCIYLLFHRPAAEQPVHIHRLGLTKPPRAEDRLRVTPARVFKGCWNSRVGARAGRVLACQGRSRHRHRKRSSRNHAAVARGSGEGVSLRIVGRIPGGVKQDDTRGCRQVDAQVARFGADEEQACVGRCILEMRDHALALRLRGSAVQPANGAEKKGEWRWKGSGLIGEKRGDEAGLGAECGCRSRMHAGR